MKNVFITGPTGFIGLNLIERLLERKWKVAALHLPEENLKYLQRCPQLPGGR